MAPDHNRQLEAEISRELKALPELAAPGALVNRVMAALEKRARLPWYRRSWQNWPASLQAASLVLLLALFGTLCLGAWELSQAGPVVHMLQVAGNWFAGLGALQNTFNLLVKALFLVVQKLGTGVIITAIVASALAYALCVGIGTVYLRFAYAKN